MPAAAAPCFASGAPLLGSSPPRAKRHRRLHLANQSAAASPSRREVSVFLGSSALLGSFGLSLFVPASPSMSASPEFFELPDSGGVRVLDLRIGSGEAPSAGDEVAIHYYGRLAAKQGWRFDSTYDHKDSTGDSVPFVFTLGSENVISGIQAAVKSMKVGGIRRVVIPPSQGYQSTSQEPIPPNFFDRQRLFTTIFNPTRLANGEGSTLGTLIFDIELVNLRHQ
ncbi:peptidyl-prolyl cis-trans isomerase FKBP17-1, chloroplastic [Syzygium oleosum]|uniref:peptidyl-prolyl cis-trans isomerase FKBP17-1, chloroplastic n=1 Tax=Syzygium oleosum TaxID=219896 RepID=UPI0011D1FAB9|nr:peptidyl-prolyl cis-trans isomerase FKBP17-1, chloroplastic [Syzygium oleosum]XP_030476534.1 peptidyl-prolyl cis-trans isomerase FKBP17-1, chloroplastic [Syzygium oleosum]XP_030476536.1 peptidyl-prolyl cis-trans isomerase FKBP17-1, chloroplastic [Syzygium oleosum]XP_056174008.1 peptidyl-prolyl cis-trans isomerase FKBP17-1, chloroplastic [Syzygium oleosum]